MAEKPVRLALTKAKDLKTPEGRRAFAEAILGRKIRKKAAVRKKAEKGSPSESNDPRNKPQTVKKYDDELRIVWGEVYAPNRVLPDTDGEFMEPDEIRKMAYRFMASGRVRSIDVKHDHDTSHGAFVVESFIAREDDLLFIPGSWVVGVHIPGQELWTRVKSGELNAFSMEAETVRSPRVVELDLPGEVVAKTAEADRHIHEYRVRFSPEGEFLGGETDTINGHSHLIVRGTVTEPPKGSETGHRHRYSLLEILHQPMSRAFE